MAFAKDSLSTNAKGGTELMKEGLAKHVDPDLLDKFQIYLSRYEEPIDYDRIPIYWLHDLPGDPAANHLGSEGHKKFEKLIFASHTQMQGFINMYKIPWSKCMVIENAIDPIEEHEKPTDKVKLIYHTTPHRGLEILVPVFEALCETFDNIELDVYSSFKIYGWEQRDLPYQKLFDRCREHPKINYHGTVSNTEIRKALTQSHIFAYPSIWMETSCISLIEAMSAGCLCIHPNLGALFETSRGLTMMYQYQDHHNDHAQLLYNYLCHAIPNINTAGVKSVVDTQRIVVNSQFNWDRCASIWDGALKGILIQKQNASK